MTGSSDSSDGGASTSRKPERAQGGEEWRAPRIVVWATASFALLLLLVVLGLDQGFLYPYLQPIRHVPGGDKTLHFVLLGLLALMLNACWGGRRVGRGPFLFLHGSLVVCVVATLEEFSQYYLTLRAFSLDDLFYDYLGIVILGQLGAAIGWWLRGGSAAAQDDRGDEGELIARE